MDSLHSQTTSRRIRWGLLCFCEPTVPRTILGCTINFEAEQTLAAPQDPRWEQWQPAVSNDERGSDMSDVSRLAPLSSRKMKGKEVRFTAPDARAGVRQFQTARPRTKSQIEPCRRRITKQIWNIPMAMSKVVTPH